MAIAWDGQSIVKGDPLYQQGIVALQSGQWDDAVVCFEVLLGKYPNDPLVIHALDEARFKARLDQETRYRARKRIVHWRPAVVRLMVALGILALVAQGVRFAREQVIPGLAEVQFEQQQAQTLTAAKAFLEAGDLDGAEAKYRELLNDTPDHPEALLGLQQVTEQREVQSLYQQGIALQESGDDTTALRVFTQLSIQWPDYRDVGQRIIAIKHDMETERLYTEAEADYQTGNAATALAKYEQVRELDPGYQTNAVTERLVTLYLALGRERIQANTATPEDVREALNYFSRALTLQPRSQEAILEQRLAKLYLDGQTWYYEGQWDESIARLAPLYGQQPGYLGGLVMNLLYDAYVRSGDQHREAGDLYFAYDQYRKATDLPVADKALAEGRIFNIVPLLTPTPTPTVTPTLTPVPTPRPPTPVPTPQPLPMYRGQIVFLSTKEGQTGFWVMDSSGQNRQYLGDSNNMRREYDELVQQAQLSPDSRFRVFVKNYKPSPQLFISDSWYPQFEPKFLTDGFTSVSYDPVWSPDGSRIAFVSQNAGGDDIWIIYPNGTEAKRLTENTWEWDKRPSWSPDSTKIVFWSNRSGIKQIYIMDADGHNVQNISNTEWDEYDSIWIK